MPDTHDPNPGDIVDAMIAQTHHDIQQEHEAALQRAMLAVRPYTECPPPWVSADFGRIDTAWGTGMSWDGPEAIEPVATREAAPAPPPPSRFSRQRAAYRDARTALEDARRASSAGYAARYWSFAFAAVGRISFGGTSGLTYSDYEVIERIAARAYPDATVEDCFECGISVPDNLLMYDSGRDESCCLSCRDATHTTAWSRREFVRYEPEPEYCEDDFLANYTASPMSMLREGPWVAPGERRAIVKKSWGEKIDTTRYFGLEIEFVAGTRSGLRELVDTGIPCGIFKSDGSLPDDMGAEFCTLPMTRRRCAVELAKASKALLAYDARAWHRSCCGLHIHVSKASASWLTWGKVERFFANPGNDGFLDRIAGREANSYCQRDHWHSRGGAPLKQAKAKHDEDHDRYSALNLATGKPTVEFRLFRGNVAYLGLMRCVEFCDALINWAQTQSAQSTLEAREFQAWLIGQRKNYPALAAYLKLAMHAAEPAEHAA